MENRNLEIYTFTLKDASQPDLNIRFDDVQGTDLFEEFRNNFIPFVDNLPPDRIRGKTCKIPKRISNDPVFSFSAIQRMVAGKINIGEDNEKEQDVVAANEDKDFLYTKEIGQSVERPFFYMIILPENQLTGFIILEREGRYGIKQVFCKILQFFVSDNLFGLHLDIRKFIAEDFVRTILEEGDYNQIILTRKNMPDDMSEAYLGQYEDSGDFDVQISIIPRNGMNIPLLTRNKILRQLDTHTSFFESRPFEQIGFDENSNLKVVTTYNGNTRTINLEDTMKIRPYYRIMTPIDAKGFSDFESIKNEAISTLQSFNLQII